MRKSNARQGERLSLIQGLKALEFDFQAVRPNEYNCCLLVSDLPFNY
jgi:hypothetical protein